MPVVVDSEIIRLSQDEFGRIAYEVMRQAFDIHQELGRFFSEEIYQTELANRCPGARTEVPIHVSFGTFRKTYFIDILLRGGAPFEIKAVNALHDRHHGQLLNYLLLVELEHGKVINFRPPTVEHEFINTSLTRQDRTTFDVDDSRWQVDGSASAEMQQALIAMLRDVGVGLDLQLYREAVIHWFGGPAVALREVDVVAAGRKLGTHEMTCTPDGAGIFLTALKPQDLTAFEDQYRRLAGHLDLHVLHWINVSRPLVTFTSLDGSRSGR